MIMDIEFCRVSKNILTICDTEFDAVSNIQIKVGEHNVNLEFTDFYGEISIDELEQIIAKMKELANE